MEKIGLLIPIKFASHKLSDDYIKGGGFFTGAFVGMQCQDTSGQSIAMLILITLSIKKQNNHIYLYRESVFSLYFKPY